MSNAKDGWTRRAVAWKIHPAIGIARAGNSPADFFVGPDSDEKGSQRRSHRDYGDADALRLPGIKRQAARFRVYAYDAEGECLGIAQSGSVASIEWTVQLANTKATAPRIAAGSPQVEGRARTPRNKNMAERWKLELRPRPRSLSGENQSAILDDARFMDIPVSLGEIRTDSEGALLVLGGRGKAITYDAAKRLRSHTDNDGWCDDLSDGPVTARLTLHDGRIVEAVPAWAVVLPPDFAPGVRPVATQFDVITDNLVRGGKCRAPEPPSFMDDVLPILNRMAGAQWVSLRAARAFGTGADAGGVDIRANLALLAKPIEATRGLRERVLELILELGRIGESRWLRLTQTQEHILRQWAGGTFRADWPAHQVEDGHEAGPPRSPFSLDRAALEACPGGVLPAYVLGDPDAFVPGEPFRLDPAKVEPGAFTRAMPCPWQAGLLAGGTEWPAAVAPEEVLTLKTYRQIQALDAEIEGLRRDGSEDQQVQALQNRWRGLWLSRQPWARGLPASSPGREEAMLKEWSYLGFVSPAGDGGEEFWCGGVRCLVETERSPHLGSMAEYFHKLVNIEANRDFVPKAFELGSQMLEDAKFSADWKYAPFRYTPQAFDERMERIYADFVDNVMYSPVPWESGDITWDAEIDFDEDDEPVRGQRQFHLGRFSDRALAERFRQFAPLNLTDGAWLQNIVAAAPMDGVKSRLAAIWLDEAGNGRPELNHSNVYDTLLRTLNMYLPPVTSRDFIELDFVPSAFESPVFQFCIGLFPNRFLPELLGMTLFVEWEATPTMHAIGKMMADRRIDPQYYRMHAAIDNINVGHGALAKEAIKLYLHMKQVEGGDAVVQEHWQRIWRGYVAWSTLGNCGDEIVERMMLVDKKQIHLRSSLLLSSDILPPFVAALRKAADPVSAYLRQQLAPGTIALLDAWTIGEPPPALLDQLRRDLNACLRAGLYDKERFAAVRLSAASRNLLRLQPVNLNRIDLGRCLLEDAYPDGIARRPGFPDIKAYYAARMAELVRRKTPLALQSHRRFGWLMQAFRKSPEAVMEALIARGLIDRDHPLRSRLFEQTEFSGPMFKVFTEEEKTVIVDWIESLRAGDEQVQRPEPAEQGGTGFQDSEHAADRPLSEKRWRLGMGAVH